MTCKICLSILLTLVTLWIVGNIAIFAYWIANAPYYDDHHDYPFAATETYGADQFQQQLDAWQATDSPPETHQ